jgi:hypothetical protein
MAIHQKSCEQVSRPGLAQASSFPASPNEKNGGTVRLKGIIELRIRTDLVLMMLRAEQRVFSLKGFRLMNRGRSSNDGSPIQDVEEDEATMQKH